MLWRKLLPHPVLAADTTLEVDGEIVGKPHDAAEAHAILERLSGRRHRVLTAVAMSDGERTRSRLSVSEVAFRRLSEHDIRRYVAIDDGGHFPAMENPTALVSELRAFFATLR